MKLWRGSDGKWYEAACPGGGVEYVARTAAEDAEVEAALGEAIRFADYFARALVYLEKYPGAMIFGFTRRSIISSFAIFNNALELIKALAQLRAAKAAE